MTKKEIIRIAQGLITDFKCESETMVDFCNVVIQALEQEPCTDAISRQAALDTFGLSEKSRKYGGDHSGYDTIMLYEVQDALEALPSVQPQPKTGHWIKDNAIQSHCSECGKNAIVANWSIVLSDYCPFCGCLMDRNDFDTYIKSESEVENG